jgi:hypothetical protein
MSKLLREPLVHFIVLGALVFAAYGWLNRNQASVNEIVVTSAQIDLLTQQFQRVWQRPPIAEELKGLIESHVREEVLYREGVAVGLDRDDPVVRRRVSQKMQFLADEMTPEPPTDADLQKWLDKHADKYAIEPRYSFDQVFFNPARHGASIDKVLANARAQLARAGNKIPALGDATMLSASIDDTDVTGIEKSFDAEFVQSLKDMPTNEWRGPVRSNYGVHFVRIRAYVPAQLAKLEQVRAQVERDWLHAQAQEVNEAFYKALRDRYSVSVESTTVVKQ